MAVTAINLLDTIDDISFYSNNRTPSYAVKFIREAIDSNPIVESQLIRHGLIYAGNSRSDKIPSTNSSNSRSSYFATNNYWKSEVVGDGKTKSRKYDNGHTKTSLLREQAIRSKRINHSRPCSQESMRYHTVTSNSRKDSNNEVSYGFMVGSRYTKQNYFQSSCDNYSAKIRLASKESKLSTNPTNSISVSPQNSPKSPPNSPAYLQENVTDNRPINDEVSDNKEQLDPQNNSLKTPQYTRPKTAVVYATKDPQLHRKSPIQIRTITTRQALTKPYFHNKTLPFVQGFNISSSHISGKPFLLNKAIGSNQYNRPSNNLSRAEMNLRLSKSARNNRRIIQSTGIKTKENPHIAFAVDHIKLDV